MLCVPKMTIINLRRKHYIKIAPKKARTEVGTVDNKSIPGTTQHCEAQQHAGEHTPPAARRSHRHHHRLRRHYIQLSGFIHPGHKARLAILLLLLLLLADLLFLCCVP